MKKIWGKRVLLPDGWSYNTLVEIDEKGKIKEIKKNVRPSYNIFDTLIPSPMNLLPCRRRSWTISGEAGWYSSTSVINSMRMTLSAIICVTVAWLRSARLSLGRLISCVWGTAPALSAALRFRWKRRSPLCQRGSHATELFPTCSRLRPDACHLRKPFLPLWGVQSFLPALFVSTVHAVVSRAQ